MNYIPLIIFVIILVAVFYGISKWIIVGEIIKSLALGLFVGAPVGGLIGCVIAQIQINACIARVTCDKGFGLLGLSMMTLIIGIVIDGLLAFGASVMYYKDSRLEPSSSEKRKNNEKTKRY